MTMPGPPPLADVRVLDASRVLAGPFCGQILGDLGAEVIKIERPGGGDETREWGPPFLSLAGGLFSAYYLSCNRNKRGICLDLAQAEGSEVFRSLAERSDVVLENFRADSANKLGLAPERLLSVNPRLVICSISGFGRDSAWRDVPGYDFAIQALSGLMSITGPPAGPPSKVGVAVTDVLTGLYAAVAVLACLRARQTSGHGFAIDLALLDCALAGQVNVAQTYLTGGEVPAPQGNAHLQIVPYQLFATADGWIVLAVGNDGQWRRFCEAAGRPELVADDRFRTNPQRVANRERLVPMIEAIVRARSTAAWRETLLKVEVPHAPVWNYRDLFASEQSAGRGLKIEVRDPNGQKVDLISSPFRISGTALPAPRLPPSLGADTEAVLKQLLDMDANEIQGLRERGVV